MRTCEPWVLRIRSIRRWAVGAACVVALLATCSGCGRPAGLRAASDGIEALREGRHEVAARKLRRALRAYPESSSLYYNLGTAYWMEGRLDAAIEAFEESLRIDPADRRAWLFKGHLLLRRQDWDAARQAFEAAIHHTGPDPAIATAIAITELRAERPDMARMHLNQALDLDPEYAPALYNLASLHSDPLNNPRRAFELYKLFHDISTDNQYRDKAHAAMLRLRPVVEDVRQPSPETRRAPETEPVAVTPTENRILQARRLLDTNGDIDRALSLLKQAVESDPDNPDALWYLAQTYARQSLQARATVNYDRFRLRFPGDPRVARIPPHLRTLDGVPDPPPRETLPAATIPDLMRSAGQQRTQGLLDEAIKTYQEILEREPNSVEAWFNLGLTHHDAGNTRDALQAFERAGTLQPDNPEPIYMQALTLRAMGRTDDSAGLLDKLFALDADFARGYLLMAYVRWDQRNIRAARGHLQRYIELSPPGPSRDQAVTWLDNMSNR